MQAYECSTCRKVSWFVDSDDRSRCPTCGDANVRLLSADEVQKGREAGVYFDVDLKTGGPKR